MITNRMSIPEFMNELDLDQLELVIDIAKRKIERITGEEKVKIYVFNSGVINEGFYETEEGAAEALKYYVNSGDYSTLDELSISAILEYPEEAKRLLEHKWNE